MFLFNKNNAPRSRQSSIDFHATDPPSTEAWVSPHSEPSTYQDMGSPERRERGFAKRNSVFTLRSRSNTSTSTTSSFVTRTSTITSMTSTDMSSRRSSQDMSGSQLSLQQVPGQKRSLFSRGKKLRRQSSQVSALSGLDGIEEADTGKRSSVLRKDRKLSRYGSQSPIYDLKEHISSPFDFQHLTHTHRQQFPALDRTPQNELVAEFWAVRASQIPRRELHGIKADDLHFQNFSSEAVDSTNMRSHSSLARSPPPLSPQRSRDQFVQDSPSPVLSARPSLRHSRSVESFSQPVVKARHRLSQSVNPPPRSSSRMALERIDDFQGEQPAATGFTTSLRNRYSRTSGAWDRSAPPSRPSTAGSLSTVTADATFIAQAVTTPDDTAIPALSPGFTSDLENVPEEPERFFNPRPAPMPPLRSPPFDGFRSPQWSPTSRSTSRTSSYGTPKSFSQRSPRPRPTSQMSDTLGSPIQLRSGKSSARQSPAAKRKSVYWKNIDESWEDDIDYCYEHAAEADCEYDWDRNSVECDEEKKRPASSQAQQNEVPLSPTQTLAEQDEDEVLQTRFFPGAFRPSLLVPSTNSLPELDHRSAVSASTTDAGALTPLDIFSSPPVHEAGINTYMDPEGFSLTPSLLVPQDFKYQSMREEMYEDLLAEYEQSDRHYPILDTAQSVSGSSRSSRVRLSKRSSYDSSLLSGQGSISSPVRRSASSSGSLPELVHSRRGGRKTLDLMVDQLSEQTHTFAHLDEDDEASNDGGADARPSTATERTFFADDDDHTPTQDEDALKLEPVAAPAPAPTPSAPAHHERAASDGAAKLLSSAMCAPAESPKRRARAASAATSYRPKPYTLSLFPAPPKARKATP